MSSFLKNVEVPKLSEKEANDCEGIVSEDECTNALKSMKNDSSPGSDGITAAWYKVFWSKVKLLVVNSMNDGF